jgi:CheY-like chemotaxis protein
LILNQAVFPILAVIHEASFVYLLRNFLNAASPQCQLHVTRHSDETISYLKGAGIYRNRKQFPYPKLILLDTTNPDASDLHVLSWVKTEKRLMELAVVILAETPEQPNIQRCLDLGANSFLAMRGDLSSLNDIILGIADLDQFPRQHEL